MRGRNAILLSLLFIVSIANPQVFGKNKVQYKQFGWKVMKTDHFEIYFYEGEGDLAQFVSEVAEHTYRRFEEDFKVGVSKTIPIIIYNSHNDFEQTNVISELLEESVAGFTEIFKNRVVIPFNGSYGDFERVTIHELTHAFQFDILYGRGPGSLITRVYQFQFPLWLAEGMAQFQSKEWDTESDMILRDLTINEKLIPIDQLEYLSGSYLVYVEGESILRYIEETYGREKIFELFHQLGARKNIGQAVKNTFGFSVTELDEKWQRWLKLRYWPVVGERESLEKYGRALTDHSEDGSILNVTPKLSPDGKKIAYISDRSRYSDVYLISALDGTLMKHLVKGERSSGFESVHIYRGGIGWSPDASQVILIAKSHGRDIAYIMDANTGKLREKLEFDLDGVYSPDWSPSGDEICFVGLKNGTSDLYVYDLRLHELTRLTHDKYEEKDPSWSPCGDVIAFASDREELGGKYALFTMKRDGSAITQVGFRSDLVSSPSWSEDGDLLAFVSDPDGISNIYLLDIQHDRYTQLTNVVTGITTIHWVGDKLVFSAFQNIGWDLYVMKNPEDYAGEMISIQIEPGGEAQVDADSGEKEVERYGLRFSPDWVYGGVSYSTVYGLAGQSEISLSDVLGNHRIYLVSDLIQSIEESNFLLAYWYLPRRVDYGFAIFQQKYYYLLLDGGADILSEREYGAACLMSYPFDKFRRVDLQFESYLRERTLYEYSLGSWWSYGKEKSIVLIPYLSLVYDNTLSGMTGPSDGLRCNITYGTSIGVSSNALRFSTLVGDLRKYWRLTDRYSIATRLSCAYTAGRDAERFWIGGSENLRGYDDYSFSGYYVGFFNAELRYPFIDRFSMAFPLPMEIRNLRGSLFLDLGAACDSPSDLVLIRGGEGGFRLSDLKLGFGAGIRFPISFFLIKLDFAKNTNLQEVSQATHVHFSLGADF